MSDNNKSRTINFDASFILCVAFTIVAAVITYKVSKGF